MSHSAKERPRVSVLVAVRDSQESLDAALATVARQTMREWECVVVDDGSRRAVRVPEEERFRLLRSEPFGVAEARNRGLELCRGEYVAVLDADDLMHRDRLRRQTAALDAHPEWVGVGSHVRYFPRAELGDGMREYERWLNSMRTAACVRRDAWIEMPVGHPTLMLRADALRRAGGWRDRGWPEDWDLFLRLVVEAGGDVGVVPRKLLAWRLRGGSLSRSGGAFSIEAFQRCRAAFLASSFLAAHEDYVLWGYGRTGRKLAGELRRHGKRFSHVVEVHPRRLGKRIHGAPVVPPEELRVLRPRRLVVSVAGAEARAQIRAALAELKLDEGRDFVCAA